MDRQEVSAEEARRHRDALFLVERDVLQTLQDEEGGASYRALCAMHRINALTVCKGAEHGWPGATFSCIEILVAGHVALRRQVTHVILSKGHAAAAQYAVLYGIGKLTRAQLLAYKDGASAHGLEAHADLYCDTGSLGQCLSIVAGFAALDPTKIFVVVVGDGEMQEGQNYEALMTLRHRGLSNVVVVVDVNEFQSDRRCAEVMPIEDLAMVLRGFGCVVHASVDGHDVAQVSHFIQQAAEGVHAVVNPELGSSNGGEVRQRDRRPTVILAKTVKAGGTSLMNPELSREMQCLVQPWHTRIPTWEQYVALIEEQLENASAAVAVNPSVACKAAVDHVKRQWKVHRELHHLNHDHSSTTASETCSTAKHPVAPLNRLRNPPSTPPGTRHDVGCRDSAGVALSTGAAFGRHLSSMVMRMTTTTRHAAQSPWERRQPPLAIVSADLASSCHVTSAVNHPLFFELGVAEQNAVSFAGGLALHPDPEKRLCPVVCTYSVFLKRACEQIQINLVEGARVWYAGFYSGLCYHTDGKSHQSLNDASFFSAFPGLLVVDPINAAHAIGCLDFVASHCPDRSVYFRLRRTPIRATFEGVVGRLCDEILANPLSPFVVPRTSQPASPSVRHAAESRELVRDGDGDRRNIVPRQVLCRQPAPEVMVVMGTVSLALALACRDGIQGWSSAEVVVVPCIDKLFSSSPISSVRCGCPRFPWRLVPGAPLSHDCSTEPLASCKGSPSAAHRSRVSPQRVLSLEDDFGALKSLLAQVISDSDAGVRPRRFVSKVVEQTHGPSFRTLGAALDFFGFTVESVARLWEGAAACSASSSHL